MGKTPTPANYLAPPPKRKRAPRPDRFEYFRGADGDWWWRLRDGNNGNIIAGSTEGYRNEGHCLQMIGRVRSGSPEASISKVTE